MNKETISNEWIKNNAWLIFRADFYPIYTERYWLWLNTDEKLILSFIYYWTKRWNRIYATNAQLAILIESSEKTAQRYVKDLKEKWFIIVEEKKTKEWTDRKFKIAQDKFVQCPLDKLTSGYEVSKNEWNPKLELEKVDEINKESHWTNCPPKENNIKENNIYNYTTYNYVEQSSTEINNDVIENPTAQSTGAPTTNPSWDPYPTFYSEYQWKAISVDGTDDDYLLVLDILKKIYPIKGCDDKKAIKYFRTKIWCDIYKMIEAAWLCRLEYRVAEEDQKRYFKKIENRILHYVEKDEDSINDSKVRILLWLHRLLDAWHKPKKNAVHELYDVYGKLNIESLWKIYKPKKPSILDKMKFVD